MPSAPGDRPAESSGLLHTSLFPPSGVATYDFVFREFSELTTHQAQWLSVVTRSLFLRALWLVLLVVASSAALCRLLELSGAALFAMALHV